MQTAASSLSSASSSPIFPRSPRRRLRTFPAPRLLTPRASQHSSHLGRRRPLLQRVQHRLPRLLLRRLRARERAARPHRPARVQRHRPLHWRVDHDLGQHERKSYLALRSSATAQNSRLTLSIVQAFLLVVDREQPYLTPRRANILYIGVGLFLVLGMAVRQLSLLAVESFPSLSSPLPTRSLLILLDDVLAGRRHLYHYPGTSSLRPLPRPAHRSRRPQREARRPDSDFDRLPPAQRHRDSFQDRKRRTAHVRPHLRPWLGARSKQLLISSCSPSIVQLSLINLFPLSILLVNIGGAALVVRLRRQIKENRGTLAQGKPVEKSPTAVVVQLPLALAGSNNSSHSGASDLEAQHPSSASMGESSMRKSPTASDDGRRHAPAQAGGSAAARAQARKILALEKAADDMQAVRRLVPPSDVSSRLLTSALRSNVSQITLTIAGMCLCLMAMASWGAYCAATDKLSSGEWP